MEDLELFCKLLEPMFQPFVDFLDDLKLLWLDTPNISNSNNSKLLEFVGFPPWRLISMFSTIVNKWMLGYMRIEFYNLLDDLKLRWLDTLNVSNSNNSKLL